MIRIAHDEMEGYMTLPMRKADDAYTLSEVMEAIKDTQLIAEINTKSLFKHQRTFPHQRYYRQLKMMEIPVVINSDVHMPELINAGREETISKYNNL